WLADRIPDAPSIASRFNGRLDLLCTAGGDRLWKLVVNLATGGYKYGLHQFDYFGNEYYAQVPYRIDGGKRDVWIRIVPYPKHSGSDSPADGAGREQALTSAAGNALFRIEAQRAGADEPFVAIAEIILGEEIDLDQESLHFDPVAALGFEPHGFFTGLRKVVYPASVR